MLERGREIENQWFTKHPLLAETIISAETPSFGRKTYFGRIAERDESRKAETETYFGRKFRPKPNRNSIRLTTTVVINSNFTVYNEPLNLFPFVWHTQ